MIRQSLELYHKITDKPTTVKDLGRRISGFDDEIWTAERYEIVKAGNLHKFKQHSELSEYLLGTGDRVLVEASPVDRILGIGLNLLGSIDVY